LPNRKINKDARRKKKQNYKNRDLQRSKLDLSMIIRRKKKRRLRIRKSRRRSWPNKSRKQNKEGCFSCKAKPSKKPTLS
jgi:hypothetical protein